MFDTMFVPMGECHVEGNCFPRRQRGVARVAHALRRSPLKGEPKKRLAAVFFLPHVLSLSVFSKHANGCRAQYCCAREMGRE